MEIRQIELFLAVIDCASVTKAAAQMNLTPGAVSAQLHSLAAELRAELFARQGRHLVPTPAALRLAEQTRAVVRQIRQIEREYADPQADTRPIHFAAGATTLIHRLGQPLRLLRAQYPHTQIRVTVANTEEMVVGLLDREYDLALISLPCAQEELSVTPLFDEELVVLQPSPSPVRRRGVGLVTPGELAPARFLLYPKTSNMRAIIEGFFHELNLDPEVIMEAADTEALKSLVEYGFGWTIVPEFAVRQRPCYYRVMRVDGHKLVRRQALAMVRSDYPRPLTLSIASFLRSVLVADGGGEAGPRIHADGHK